MADKKLYELTNPQKTIWYTEQFYKGSNVNNIGGLFSIDDEIDTNLLKEAAWQFVRDNDAFRTKLVYDENGDIKQYFSDFEEFDIPLINLKDENELNSLKENSVRDPFSLINENLFRFIMYRFPNNKGGLLLVAHHIIYDAFTASLTASKIINNYSDLKNGRSFTEKPTSYLNYIESENNYLNSEKYNKDKEFWNKIYETVPEIAEIPSIKPESDTSSSAKRKTFIIDKDFNDKINEFCSNNKISPFNFFMGLYAIYIGRVSNLDDFVIGTPIFNRSNFEEKNTPGMFISTLALRLTLNNEECFIDFAKKIAADSFSMFRHQKYSYQNILDDVRKINPNQPNLYDILISYQNARTNRNSSDIPYRVDWFFNNNVADKMQIHLSDLNDDGCLNVSYDYRINKYDEKDIDAIHSRILHMIMQVLSSADISLNNIEIVTPEEKDIILNKFNDTNLEYDKNITIVDYFENQVEKTPNNVALVCNNQTLTYKELNEKSNSLAHYLRENGIKNNSIVGVMTNRSFEMIIGILAVLKSGGAYIPIDPEYPEERVTYVLENSKCSILLSQKELNNNLQKINFKGKTILIDLSDNSIYSNDITNLTKINKPEDLSYIIYTSGSTGNPKGVMLTHKNTSNFYNSMVNKIDYLKDGKYHSIASITTVSFDIFAFETIISLTRGLKLFITNNAEQKMTLKIEKLLLDNKIEIIQTTPSIMSFHIENSGMNGFSGLKYIMLAGEQLPKQLVEKIHKITPDCIVYNGYGPSETTIFSTVRDVTNLDTITIGKPIDNTQIYILDKNLNVLPKGVLGEIYIAGDGVGRGYLNNTELTKERYLPNPFNHESIMYKTGDVGYWLDNGEILCKGRIDNQVKLRGLRIELGEIESKINEFNTSLDIKSAVIVKNIDNKDSLNAFISCEKEIDINELQNYLIKYLPKYMIPNTFTILDKLPFTPNGKIDRKALKNYKIEAKNNNHIIESPKTDIEKGIFERVSKLLNTDDFGISDSFFNIGMDSLGAINLASKLSKDFNIDITIRDIYDSNTIKNLALLVENLQNKNTYLRIEKAETKEYYKLSSAQKRIYFSSKVSGDDSCLYNMPGVIIFDSMPDIDKLNECFNKIIKRHSSLRTSFEIVNDEVCQKIVDNIDFKIKVTSSNKDNIDEIAKDFVKPFNLAQAPLLRAQIVKLKTQVLLLFDMHHIISDGSSLTVLTKELCSLYNDKELKPLKLSYVDYSEWENNNIENNKLENSKEYWVNQFKNDIPVLNMPTDHIRPAVQSFEGAKIYNTISKELTNKINKLSKELKVSNYMILLSCYYILLSKYTSQEDIVVGTPVIARNKSELLNMIGMFVNSMPLKNHIDSSASFKDFLNIIKQNTINSIEHQDYPFDELVNELHLTRDTSRNPLFDTMFIYQNNGYTPVNFNGIKSKLHIPDINISKFDLSLEVVPTKNKLELTFEYAISLFNKDTINNLSNHYLNIVKQVIDNINIKICDIDILSTDEKEKILFDFNNTTIKYDENKTIATLFEEQALKTPNDIALVFGDSSLTFKELNEKSNSLAYYLKNNLDIKNNDIVGVMASRSLEVIISILAVVKAGGAYIPIDPTFPKERVSYMLNNSNAKVLLTQNKFIDKINFENKITVDLENNKIYDLPNDNLEHSNIPEDLMYVIYTSGSTGNPKGVMVTHRVFSNFTNYCNDYVKYLKNPSNKAIVSITTISFDIFAYETLISLQKGLKVVLANENEQTTPHLLNKLMEKNNVKIIQSTPSIIQIFINNVNDMPALKKIEYAILAGEQLPLDLVKTLHSFSNIVVYNGYGPSETYYCTLAEMNDELITIGKPIYNSQMYILDKNLKPVPVGVIGDIYISGECVGKGYLNNKELTDKSFIPNPFLDGVTMYRSGDLGKYLEDGNILCLGRSDHQIKIRGLRIELGEIESLLLKYPHIIKATVAKQSLQNREFISAYYVSDKRISITELRKYLTSYLPKYMVPSYYTALDDLPYTPNGKVDKKLLPLPSEIVNNDKEDYVAPKTDIQKQLVEIWEKVLNTKPIGINDNFFELGGDSLLAMNLNMELSKITDKITYQNVFHYPTIAELEKIIESDDKIELFNKVEDIPEGVMYVLDKSKKFKRIKKSHSKNILLTGSTGFLGIHILEELLRIDNVNIYCIIRSEPGLTAENKLIQKLDFYFDGKYKDLINKRIFILTGNTSKPNFGLEQNDLINIIDTIDTVINSAANVSHYGKYDDFYKANVLSVKYMIAFCRNYNKKLYHISTTGVAGISLDSSYLTNKKKNNISFDESDLYIGQHPETVYSYTKFEAEIQVLTAINNGLDGYILRMGNLMPRFRDGKFQENVASNAFINRVASFVRIGIVPDYLIDFPLEFTPIDYAAKAICEIVSHFTDTNRVFHIFNNKYVPFSKCLKILRKQNYNLEVLNEKDFINRINEIFKSEDYKYLLKYILDDFDENTHIDYRANMKIKSKFTKRYLRRTLFFWPRISDEYLVRFLNILKEVL